VLDGFRRLPRLLVQQGDIVVRRRVVGIERQGAQELGAGVLALAESLVDQRQVDHRVETPWIDLQRGAELRGRLIEQAPIKERDPEVVCRP